MVKSAGAGRLFWGAVFLLLAFASLELLAPPAPRPAGAAEGKGASSAGPAAKRRRKRTEPTRPPEPTPPRQKVNPNELADEVLGGQYKRRFTEHYRVYADTDGALARDVGQAAETIYRTFLDDFENSLPRDPQGRLVVLVFENQREFLAFAQRLSGQRLSGDTGGFYHDGLQALVVYDLGQSSAAGQINNLAPVIGEEAVERYLREANRRIVYHEGCHQLQYQTGMFNEGCPLWLSEGQAMAYQCAEITPERLVVNRRTAEPLLQLRQLSAGRFPWPLAQFLTLGSETHFLGPAYDGDRGLAAYGLCWLLYRYLRFELEGGKGKMATFVRATRQLERPQPSPGLIPLLQSPDEATRRAGEERWMQEVSRALAGPRLEAFRQAFGIEPAALEPQLLEFMRRLPDPPAVEIPAKRPPAKRGG